ncbi:hypothetical protein BDZ94DRAFT_1302355 [Collybia nuda]|uniref:F-box domain-containing protein n=1 Tax=Collybia nuda TaxID=64659 RepID=A0A9P6CD59_9AGAR|nr:hypothetical protein BDZ94DRAFT_1302355 [Collybia nuda]
MALPPTLLTDLPPELLHEICSGLDTRTLLLLSQMCHGLFDVAQPIIFKHQIARLQSLADSGDLIIKPGREIKSLMNGKGVPLEYIHLNLSNSTSWKTQTLHSCYGLFSRMDYAGCTDIHLSLGHAWKHPNQAVSGWFQLAAIMNAIVGNPGSMLTVTGGEGNLNHWPFTYTLLPTNTSSTDPPPPVPPLNSTKNSIPIIHQFLQFFASLRTRFSAPRNTLVGDPTPLYGVRAYHIVQNIKTSPHKLPRHPSPLLHAFHINGNHLLHLPFFSWTIDTINKAPITCLSFEKTDLREQDWGYILQNITIPTLNELSFGSSRVTFPDLQLFLERHSSITILNLMGGTAIGCLVPYSSKKLLPQLVEFAGDPDYTEHFLQPPEAHPDLNFITMSSEFGIISFEYQYSRFDDVLELIAQRKQTMSLVLLLQSEAGLLNWLQNSTCPPVENLNNLEIRVEGRFFVSTAIKRAICDWLEHFPSLFHFKININFDVSDDTLDINTLFWDRFKQLETVECGRNTYRRAP